MTEVLDMIFHLIGINLKIEIKNITPKNIYFYRNLSRDNYLTNGIFGLI